MEIERKFLVKTIPNFSEVSTVDFPTTHTYANIEQHYLSYSPEIRIRKSNNIYTIALKTDGDLIREELESFISQQTFENLKVLAKSTIKKTRYYVPYNTHILEIDEYEDIDLVTVEIEFKSKEDAEKFTPLDWFGEEVTYNKKYKNKNLAKGGL